MSLRRFALRTLAAVTIFAVLAVGALWLERSTGITLPTPTGRFAVGRSIYDWVDDPQSPKRELLVWIWYPATASSGAVIDDYLPAWLRTQARVPPIFRFLTRDVTKVHGHSLRDAEVSPEQPSYPVVIMRAGASVPVVNYSTLAEDLASHGYVVVGFDAPYRTSIVVFPDGRIIARRPENNPELYSGAELERVGNKLLAAWIADTGFVLDRLAQFNGKFMGRLDMTRVGFFGHSFGGATAAQFCSQDSRCKAGIDIDGSLHGSVIETGIHKPFMFLLSERGDFSSDAEVRQIQADIQSVYDRLPADARIRIAIRGANHFTFSDDGALLKSRILRGMLRLFGGLGIDGRRQLVVTAYCVHSFFDAYLKGPRVSRLDTSAYPEIRILK